MHILKESGSSLGTFMDCPKKYEFNYIKKLSSKSYPKTLVYGSFIHAFVEMNLTHKELMEELLGKFSSTKLAMANQLLEHITQMSFDKMCPIQKEVLEALDKYAKSGMESEIGEAQIQEISLDLALALDVSKLWKNHWSAKSGDLSPAQAKVLEAEREWSFDLHGKTNDGTSFVHVGKSDGVICHESYKKTLLYELKTSGDPSREAYKHRLELDKQINSNLISMQVDGFTPSGVLYDIIWKPLIKLKKDRKTMPDETMLEFYNRIVECYEAEPEKYFERLMVFRSDKDIAEYKKDLYAQFNALRFAYSNNYFYRNTNSCEKFGKLCPYFNACMDDQEKELEEGFNKRIKKFPELSNKMQREG